MNRLVKAVLIGMVLIPLLSASGTYSYFVDTKYSTDNTFTAAVWDTQATFLDVNTSESRLTGVGHAAKMFHTTIQNIGTQDIAIDKIGMEWNETSTGNITMITIGGATIWEGEEPSGEILDNTNYTLIPGADPIKITFWFNGPVEGPFFIKFIMADGAAKLVMVVI